MGKKEKRVLRFKSIKLRKVVIKQSKAILKFRKTVFKKQRLMIDDKRVIKHDYKPAKEFKECDINIVGENDETKPVM